MKRRPAMIILSDDIIFRKAVIRDCFKFCVNTKN